jgi:glutamyl-tRNA synthetase
MKAAGSAYPCFCNPEELAAKREVARSAGGFSGYDRSCRRMAAVEAASRLAAGEPHVWRLAVPLDRGPVVVDDAVRGSTEFPIEALDDFVLVRSDGTPTYNFATVVDDADMEITHIIRGDDHLTNTPRQILVFEALGRPVPAFAHLSMIWGADGKKLSKRHGATSVEAYEEAGYLPQALLNYLALLGWSLDGETTIVPPDMLTANFSLDRISKNPAIFDPEKLEWMNGAYLREMSPSEFVDAIIPWLERAGLCTAKDVADDRLWFEALATLIAERTKRLDEVADKVAFLFREPAATSDELRSSLSAEGTAAALVAAADELARVDFTAALIEEALRAIPAAIGVKPKIVFQAVRIAVTGSNVSPPLFESLELLGRERTLSRIAAAQELIG